MTSAMSQVVEHGNRGASRAGKELGRHLHDLDRAMAERAGEPAWLMRLRRDGMDQFARGGFPTTADEEWKFTSVRPIAETPFVWARDGAGRIAARDLEPFSLAGHAAELVFVNGRPATALFSRGALPGVVEAATLEPVLARTDTAAESWLRASWSHSAFSAWNAAAFPDGAFIRIPANTIVEQPIHLLFFSSAPDGPIVSHPRVVVVVGENSQVRLVESYAGPAGQTYLTNSVSQVFLAENAVVDHYRVQRESLDAFHVGLMHVTTARDSTFSSHSLTFGGSIVRNDVVAVLNGEGGDCTLNGLYLATGHQLIDNHTTIDHAQPHCGSHEVYKGILGDRSRGVFNGKIIVRPDAQKTDAKQTNRALLLSDEAQINTKPQLEIFANDVRCTHGATIGQLDDDAIFYLRARGLSLREARQMLIHAFAGDILNRIKIEPVRVALERRIEDQLPDDRT
jgi:Fe-S cluster assembly protein SufD